MSTTKRSPKAEKAASRTTRKSPAVTPLPATMFAVHTLVAVRVEGREANDTIPVYENVLLIQATDGDDAERRATDIASLEDEEELRWDGKPARLRFVGIRKVIECQPFGTAKRIGDGAELTYSVLSVASDADLKKLAAGDPVIVTYSE